MRLFFIISLIFFSSVVYAQNTKKITLSKADLDTLKNFADKLHFSGNVLLYSGGKPTLTISKGYSDVEQKITNNENTRFNIGSIGKSLTAILIMQLVEKNILELDKPANNYLPKQFQLQYNHQITLRELLNMTSGLGDYFDHTAYRDSISSTNGLMNLVLSMKPTTDATGVKFVYSNSGFIVLGKILESYYKKDYQEIVTTKILVPANILTSTNKYAAKGYSLQDSTWVLGKDNSTKNWSAAGGLYLSVAELHAIIESLNKEKYINKKSIDAMWAKESHPENDPPFSNYGLGWMVENPGNIQLKGHNGGVRGFQSVFRYLPDDDLYIYVFSNHENGAEELFMQQLLFLLAKKGILLQ